MKTILTNRLCWFLIFLSLGPITFGCTSSQKITLLEEAEGKEIHIYAREGKIYKLHSFRADSTGDFLYGKGRLEIPRVRMSVPFEGNVARDHIERIEAVEPDVQTTFLLFVGIVAVATVIALSTFSFQLGIGR